MVNYGERQETEEKSHYGGEESEKLVEGEKKDDSDVDKGESDG